MSASGTKERVLFIGVVQDGKVVQERPMSAGQTVSVGSSQKATFVFEAGAVPEPAFELFRFVDGAYVLRFAEGMKGRVTSNGERISLDKVVKDSGDGKGTIHSVPLTASDKGKIRLDGVTVLFKFVEPSTIAAPAPTVDKLDFRPRLIEDDQDPIFLGFLALWFALGVVFSVWVITAEPPEFTLEDIPDRFTKRVFVDIPDLEPLDDPTEDPEGVIESDKAKAKAVEPEPVEAKPEPKDDGGGSEADQAQRVENAKDELRESSAMFSELQALQAQMIGTTGENARGSVLVENAVGNYEGLGDKLADAESAGGPIGDGSRLRGSDGVAGGTGVRDIGGVSEGGDEGGGVGVGAAPKVEAPKGDVTTGDLDFGGGDVAAVQAVVRRYGGQIKYCYESQLKSNPSLAGEVKVGWFVEGGKASDVYIISNSTGDSKLGDCIVGKIKRWKFTGEDEGEASTRWVFAPQD